MCRRLNALVEDITLHRYSSDWLSLPLQEGSRECIVNMTLAPLLCSGATLLLWMYYGPRRRDSGLARVLGLLGNLLSKRAVSPSRCADSTHLSKHEEESRHALSRLTHGNLWIHSCLLR